MPTRTPSRPHIRQYKRAHATHTRRVTPQSRRMRYYAAVKDGVVVSTMKTADRTFPYAVLRRGGTRSARDWFAAFHPSREHAEWGLAHLFRSSFDAHIVPTVELTRDYEPDERLDVRHIGPFSSAHPTLKRRNVISLRSGGVGKGRVGHD
jgi:hypothetical protein